MPRLVGREAGRRRDLAVVAALAGNHGDRLPVVLPGVGVELDRCGLGQGEAVARDDLGGAGEGGSRGGESDSSGGNGIDITSFRVSFPISTTSLLETPKAQSLVLVFGAPVPHWLPFAVSVSRPALFQDSRRRVFNVAGCLCANGFTEGLRPSNQREHRVQRRHRCPAGPQSPRPRRATGCQTTARPSTRPSAPAIASEIGSVDGEAGADRRDPAGVGGLVGSQRGGHERQARREPPGTVPDPAWQSHRVDMRKDLFLRNPPPAEVTYAGIAPRTSRSIDGPVVIRDGDGQRTRPRRERLGTSPVTWPTHPGTCRT